MREVEKKINLENAHYEELILELELNKKGGIHGGFNPSTSIGGLMGLPSTTIGTASTSAGGMPSAASTAALLASLADGGRGHPPLTTMASLDTDTSSILGGHQPMIMISQANGKKGTRPLDY